MLSGPFQGGEAVAPWLWLLLGVVLLALETVSGTFVLAVVGGAAVLTAVVAVPARSFAVTGPAFAALSLLGLLFLRPLLLARIRGAAAAGPTNVAALTGRTARLVRPFDPQGYGRVAVGGEEWRAHLADGWTRAAWGEGASFTVLGAEGVTLEVCPEDLGAARAPGD